jgi:hypothetical protein
MIPHLPSAHPPQFSSAPSITMAPTTFTYFRDLSLELRVMIWKLVRDCDPERLVELFIECVPRSKDPETGIYMDDPKAVELEVFLSACYINLLIMWSVGQATSNNNTSSTRSFARYFSSLQGVAQKGTK